MFLGLFLAVLDEELVGLYACIGMDKPASAPTVEELDEEARSTEGQTKMGKQDFTVRQLSFLSAVSLTLLTSAWTRIDGFSRVAHLARIWWEVYFDCMRAEQAQRCHSRRLAIAPTQHQGPFLIRFFPSHPSW